MRKEELKQTLIASVMAAIEKGRTDGSYYRTDGTLVCTIDVAYCGIIGCPKFMPLKKWEEWYGQGNCPAMI